MTRRTIEAVWDKEDYWEVEFYEQNPGGHWHRYLTSIDIDELHCHYAYNFAYINFLLDERWGG